MRTPSLRASRRVLAGSVALLGFAAVLGTSSDASASGYLTARFGTDHGTPAMPNAYAIYYNPAALGGTTGTTITGDVSLLLRWAQYRRGTDALSPSQESYRNDPTYAGSNTGKGNLLNLLALPFLGVNTDFGGSKYFRGGYAFYIPFGGLATWDRADSPSFGVPGTVDRAQRWHNISGQILAIYNTFAFAVKVHPRFTIGMNVSPIIHTASTVRARNADGSDDTVVGGSLVEGRSLLEVSGFNVGGALGLYWEPTDQLRFGLSYTTQPGFGETKMSGELTTQIAATAPGTSQVDFFQTYPDIWRFGTAVRMNEKWEFRGDFEFVRWSVFERQCVVAKGATCDVAPDGRDLSGGKVVLNVPRNWKNAIGIRLGPAYNVNEDLELFGSLGLTTPAVPKETIDASTIDSTRLYGTIGAKYAVSKRLALAGSYNHIYFFDVNTDGRSIQNIPDHPSSQQGGGDYNASRSPSADGRYRSQIGFVNVNVAYTF